MKSMTISEFMNYDRKQERKDKMKKIVKKSGFIVMTGGLMIVSSDIVNASDGIDKSASKIYDKLLDVGKWIIIIKGGIDTINFTIQGDFDHAKKCFLSYLVVYMVLQGLPWAMNEVDMVFEEIS